MADFEKERLANIAERDALFKDLQKEAQTIGLYKSSNKRSFQPAPSSKRKRPASKPIKKDIDNTPRRTSSRLAGITADSEVAKQKAENDYQAVREAERAKRQRVAGDQKLGDIVVNGHGWVVDGKPLLSVDAISRMPAKPYERTFGDDDVKETSGKDLKEMRQRMNGLQLWDAWEPSRIKVTQERIYAMAFHPTEAKPVVFAGDKTGILGILDASQPGPGGSRDVKKEDESETESAKRPIRDGNTGDTDPSESDDEDPDPYITILKPHQRTISAMHTHPSRSQTLFTASYDSSIRGLDLEKSVSTDIYALDDEPISGIDMAAADPHVLYFTTLNGGFGRHDTRAKAGDGTELYQLSEKKIGGFSLNPQAAHYLATASLDRTMRLWDLRKITKKLPVQVGEHTSRLSVSHAAFNSVGQVATSSYDDSIKIHSFGVGAKSEKGKSSTDKLDVMSTWKSGYQLEDERMDPEVVIRHNNQTGRWVTILRPHWQQNPQDGFQKLVIGNMNRFVDVYNANGDQLAQLGGDGITAVPAVAVFHPSREYIAAGTASGKLCLWM